MYLPILMVVPDSQKSNPVLIEKEHVEFASIGFTEKPYRLPAHIAEPFLKRFSESMRAIEAHQKESLEKETQGG